MKKIRLFRLIVLFALCLCMSAAFLPSTALAAGDTFTVTYKTNAGVEMGTLEYEVGGTDSLPLAGELTSKFTPFFARAMQKGGVAVPSNGVWYTDKEFTTPASFPQGQAGENYIVYCKLTVYSMSAGSVMGGGDRSYADVGGSIQPYLGISTYSIDGRNDGYENTKAIFEKRNDAGGWDEVPASYYTDKSGNTWPNVIYFSSVSDSGVYRLKALRYTATDNNGEVLYYVDAENAPTEEYTVNITPVELSITDVNALARNCDGTDEVQLSGGTLNGVLYNDDVSFELGTGTLADTAAGKDKPVTTKIVLTGADALNYTLKQPEDVLVTISHAPDAAGWHSDENGHWNVCVCGEKINAGKHTGGVASCEKRAVCTVCGQEYGALTQEITKEQTVLEATGKTETADGQGRSGSPQTGDDSHIVVWLCLMLMSAAALNWAVILRRR